LQIKYRKGGIKMKIPYRTLSAASLVVSLGLFSALALARFLFEGDPSTDITLKEQWVFAGGGLLFLFLAIVLSVLGGRNKMTSAFVKSSGQFIISPIRNYHR
jgi:uncharacterized ion transporter superfamily protein YfcC